MALEHFRNSHAMREIIADGEGQPFAEALKWGQAVQAPEFEQLAQTLSDHAQRPGNPLESSAVYEATLYLLDAWIEAHPQEKAA